MVNVCLILSAGSSARFGGDMPKQYALLNGNEVIAYSIEAMRRAKSADIVIISANADYAGQLQSRFDVEVTMGGATRNQSLRNGIEYISARYPECKKLFINEAARPFVTAELIDEYFNKLDDYDAVITAQHITDSLGRDGKAVTNRAEYYLVQAPEAFRFGLLYQSFDSESPITATVQQLPQDSKVYRNYDFRHNLKITYPEDLVVAEALMRYLH